MIPAAQQKAGIIYIVIIVVMGKKQMADVRGGNSCPLQLVGCSRTTVEHQIFGIDFEYKATTETLRSRSWGTATD
jgi:hypothetical protein